MLHAKIALCEEDYQSLNSYLANRVPTQLPLLDKIVKIMEAELAANKEDFMNDLARDERGISYSCAAMLATTNICREASLSRTE